MRYIALALSAMLVVPAGLAARSDPPVQLKLSDRMLARGQSEKIHVRTAADGYLVVLRTDTQGKVRMLYPLNPTDDDAVSGGQQIEIPGRGGRDAFSAFSGPGTGMVLAAWSDQPFNFDSFTTNGHWNRAGLVADTSGADAETAMLGIVDQMSAGPYKYDVMAYSVGNRTYHQGYAGWYNNPWWYSPYFDPWYYGGYGAWPWSPYYYGPSFYGPSIYGPSFESGEGVQPHVRPDRDRDRGRGR